MALHFFDKDIATKYGIECAILLQNLAFWVEKNKANDKHYHDGHYWTYNSTKAFKELFPYMSDSKIRRSLKRLEEEGLIKTGNYNKVTYDRTIWYTITDEGFATLQNEQMHYSNCKMDYSNCKIEVDEMTNGFVQNDEPIPYRNTNRNTDIITDNIEDAGNNKNDCNLCRYLIQKIDKETGLIKDYCSLNENKDTCTKWKEN